MSGTHYRPPPATASSSSQSLPLPALVDCPHCFVQLIRIISKKKDTYGQSFVKCPNNIKDDPTTCGIIMFEDQYVAFLRNKVQLPTQWKKAIPHSPGHHVGGSVDHILDMKREVDALRQKIDSAVSDVGDLKIQVQRVKMDYVVIAALCVGVALGCLMSKIWT